MIVAICGAKRHGKGTAASALKDHGFVEINFSDALKESCAAAFGIPLETFYKDEGKEDALSQYGYPNESPRTILQHVGTEMFRSKWDDIWINTWKNKAARHKRVVCSDLRFPNEHAALRTLGAYIIRVTRPSLAHIKDTHASEAHVRSFDVDDDIVNDKTMIDLRFQTAFSVAKRWPNL